MLFEAGYVGSKLGTEALAPALHEYFGVPDNFPFDLRSLEAIQRELDHERDKGEWLRLERVSRRAVCAVERENSLKMIAALQISVERFYISLAHPDARRGSWNDENQQLIAAVRDKKSELACELLTQHLRQTHQLTIAAANHLDKTRGWPCPFTPRKSVGRAAMQNLATTSTAGSINGASTAAR